MRIHFNIDPITLVVSVCINLLQQISYMTEYNVIRKIYE